MNVRLPDGTVVQNVPDGISKAELAQKLQANGQAVPADWLQAEKPPAPQPGAWDQAMTGLKQGMGDLVHGAAALPMMLNDAPLHVARALGANIPTGQQTMDKYIPQSPPGIGRAVRQGLAGTAAGVGAGGAMGALPGAAGSLARSFAAQPIQQAVGTTAGAATGDALRQAGAPAWAQIGGSMLAGGAAGMPRPTDEARRLAERGVQMTPGQLWGGGANTVEQAMGSIPFVGDIIKSSRNAGVASFNKSVLDDALKGVGAKMPKGLSPQEQLTYTRRTLGESYDALLASMKGDLHSTPPSTGTAIGVPGQIPPVPGNSLMAELSALKTLGKNLPPQQSKDLDRIIDQDVIAKFTKQGKVSGEALQDINRVLDSEIADFGKSQDPYHQKLGQGLKEAQAAVRRMIVRENPMQAAQLDKIDRSYATFKQAQNAAARGKDGNYTPSQFEAALKQKDRTKDRRAFSEGTVPNKGLASDARKVLPNTLPDSGTATRGLVESLALGGGAAIQPGYAAALLALPGVYNPVMQQALQRAIMQGSSRDTRVLDAINAMAAQQIPPVPQRSGP